MNEAGVMSEAKHWILNEFETNRDGTSSGGGGGGGGGPPPGQGGNSSTGNAGPSAGGGSSSSSLAYSVYIDDKAFHETYLAPFYPSVKAGLGGMMCAMNRVNGTYSCESQVSDATSPDQSNPRYDQFTNLITYSQGPPGQVSQG